jgi:threonine/homoserine efflux transporter RhtA
LTRGEVKLDVVTVVATITALLGLSFVIDLWHHQDKGNWLGIVLAFIAAIATFSRMYVYGRQTKALRPAIPPL